MVRSPSIVAGLRRLMRRPPWWVSALVVLAAVTGVMAVFLGRTVIQAAIQGVVVGSIYVLGASGLSLTYGIRRFANFAHGDFMTVGAYVAFTVNVLLGQNILWGVVLAIPTVALLGMLLELSVFRRLEGRPVAALIASVGIALVLQNAISAIFLPDFLYLNVSVPRDFEIANTGLSFNWVKGGLTLGVSFTLIVFLHVMLKYTTLGKAMRACADNIDLARTSGVNTRNVILWTWAISGAFAAVAGVLLAIIVNVNPLLGFFVLLFLFSAVIVGGIGSPYGAMIGGLLVGVVQKLSNVGFGALQRAGLIEGGSVYEPAGAFLVMILVLLIKPEGIMGATRARIGGRAVWRRPRRRREVVNSGRP